MTVVSQKDSTTSSTARVFGSATAGIAEIFLFHPIDTIAKRLMTNKVAIPLNQIVFRDKYQAPLIQRYKSLFPGLGFAASYKILQRIYKFGGQPIARENLIPYEQYFKDAFGRRHKVWMDATAGSLIGIGEIVLLPLDILKIKSQTNPDSLKGKQLINLFTNNLRDLYRGAGWTAMRNAPGSFALFGGNSLAKDFMDIKHRPTLLQTFISSTVGSVTSIMVSAPLDVIKTRIQNRPFNSPEGGFTILKNLIQNEGVLALFKGLVPKITVVGPKLIFSFTVAQKMIEFFHEKLD
eukprot:NODE_316_length_11188_cov_0.303905.p4 type:complete len:293 gc:universal NODE_316_length_11188_cov_0.303905:1816-2694(+)